MRVQDWWKLSFEAGLLAVEAQQVVLLRLMKLAQGGAAANTEAVRMVTEKAVVSANVAFGTALGDGPRSAVKKYRSRVRRNARRLSRRSKRPT
jgi:hypothetical protein